MGSKIERFRTHRQGCGRLEVNFCCSALQGLEIGAVLGANGIGEDRAPCQGCGRLAKDQCLSRGSRGDGEEHENVMLSTASSRK